MKDSMILYTSYLERFKGLSDAQFGQFIRLLMAYQSTGEIPSIDDALVSLAFDMAKVDVDVNRGKYENVVRRNQENGKKGGRPQKESPFMTETGKPIPEGRINGHFLYLIKDVSTGEFKIGETQNLMQRRYTIKRPTNTLSIVDYVIDTAAECQRKEREILDTYIDYSTGGDWFVADEELAKEIIAKYFVKKPSGIIQYPKVSKKPDTDTDTVTDNVSDTDNVFSDEKPKEKDYFVVQRENERKRSEEVKQIVDAWNTLPNVAPVKSLDHNSKRYKMLCARLDDKSYGLDAVLTAIENVRFSKFLQGDNKRGWTIDFEWFVKPNNFPKVYEGNYTDRKPDSMPKAFKAIADMGWEDEEAKPIWEVLK